MNGTHVRSEDRLQAQMYVIGVVALISIVIAIAAAGLSWGDRSSLRTILGPMVNVQVDRDLRVLNCSVLADRVDGKITISCVPVTGHPSR